jgi:hypothetical protein
VIAAGRRDYAGFGDFAREHIGEGAARLKRAGVLQEFQFEVEADRIEAEVGASDGEDWSEADVRADNFFYG